jgi:hypothetical protein
MSTTFANSINSNPIYADRAEKDAAGNIISTTYATKQEIPTVPTIVGLTAGANVSITESNNAITIAATDTTYTAGTGLNLSNGEFSVDSTVVALQTDIPSVPVTDVTVDGTSVVSNGTAAIVMPTIPTVPTAGNMLSVTSNTLNVTTTAGITDIQQVASLPANPVATVLYLIPET